MKQALVLLVMLVLLANEAGRKLTKLAEPVAEDDAVTTYVRQEIARGELTIAEPPPIADVSAIRDLLLREQRDTSMPLTLNGQGVRSGISTFLWKKG